MFLLFFRSIYFYIVTIMSCNLLDIESRYALEHKLKITSICYCKCIIYKCTRFENKNTCLVDVKLNLSAKLFRYMSIVHRKLRELCMIIVFCRCRFYQIFYYVSVTQIVYSFYAVVKYVVQTCKIKQRLN